MFIIVVELIHTLYYPSMTPTLSSLVSHVHMFAVNLLSRIGSVPPRAYALAFSVFFSPFSSYTWRSPPRPTPPFLPAKTTLDGTRHGTVHLYVYDSDRLFLVPLCPPARLSYTTRNTHASTHTTHTWPLRFTRLYNQPRPLPSIYFFSHSCFSTSSLSHLPGSVDLSI
jgi:hypothetical protein